jgi:hypothetical protein
MSWRRGATALAAAITTMFIAGGAVGEEAEQVPALQLEAKISLGDVRGRIDHMAVDLSRQRLFVAALESLRRRRKGRS